MQSSSHCNTLDGAPERLMRQQKLSLWTCDSQIPFQEGIDHLSKTSSLCGSLSDMASSYASVSGSCCVTYLASGLNRSMKMSLSRMDLYSCCMSRRNACKVWEHSRNSRLSECHSNSSTATRLLVLLPLRPAVSRSPPEVECCCTRRQSNKGRNYPALNLHGGFLLRFHLQGLLSCRVQQGRHRLHDAA